LPHSFLTLRCRVAIVTFAVTCRVPKTEGVKAKDRSFFFQGQTKINILVYDFSVECVIASLFNHKKGFVITNNDNSKA
jgi:hypothetical protein